MVAAPGCIEHLVGLGQVRVAREAQPAVHMPERVLVRHQLDMALPAEGVQLQDILAGERRGACPDLGVRAVGEGVLGVELDLVDLPAGQHIDQLQRRRQRRHPITTYVKHHAARREVGPVGDREMRQLRAGLLD